MWKSKFYGAFALNRRVDLHAIDATPARWRGTAATHWLISIQAPCFPKPFADATALIGAGLAWRADAGADAPAAGGGRSLGQAELEALTAAHLWRLDPPRRETSAADAHDADAPRRRLAAAAAGVVCGRNERRDNNGDGRGTSCLLYTSPSPRDATLSRMPSSA